jgi:hypothetical protein
MILAGEQHAEIVGRTRDIGQQPGRRLPLLRAQAGRFLVLRAPISGTPGSGIWHGH